MNDGTFTLDKQGTVSTRDASAISKNNSKGTYKITGNTVVTFDNGEVQISTIYIWNQRNGKHNLVINKSSYPQDG